MDYSTYINKTYLVINYNLLGTYGCVLSCDMTIIGETTQQPPAPNPISAIIINKGWFKVAYFFLPLY